MLSRDLDGSLYHRYTSVKLSVVAAQGSMDIGGSIFNNHNKINDFLTERLNMGFSEVLYLTLSIASYLMLVTICNY